MLQTAKLQRGDQTFPRNQVECERSSDYHDFAVSSAFGGTGSTTDAERAVDRKLARLEREPDVHFFELSLIELPTLHLDNREIIKARLASPIELQRMPLTGLVTAYLARRQSLCCDSEPT
jgi:hypothetical protein